MKNRLLLVLCCLLIKAPYFSSSSQSCIEDTHFTNDFKGCSCLKLSLESHIAINCDSQRWINIPNLNHVFASDQSHEGSIASLSFKDGLLTALGQDTFRNTSAQRIDLSKNYIEHINVNGFRGLENKLYQLVLNDNNLASVPHHSLTYLHQLRYLYLQGNQIGNIPPKTFFDIQLKNLRYLHLDRNKIKVIHKGSLVNIPLQVLTLSRNSIEEIEKQSLPSSLWFLELKHNLLNQIPYLALHELQTLQTLDLESNNITTLTSHPEVKFLNEMVLLLSNNKIRSLSRGAFDSFTKLRKIDLSYNQIDKINEHAFRTVSTLHELDLSYNVIVHIPEKTFENIAKSLRTLNLEENDMHALPQGLKALKELSVLNVNSNKLASIDNALVLPFKDKLTELLLAFNRLLAIPYDVLYGMDHLKNLDISKNRLKTIDDESFPQMPNLIRLNLAGNQLRAIESKRIFDGLKNLVYLDLSHNSIATISKVAFEKLTSLESLFLQNNALTEFPRTALSSMDKLRYLLLDHNKITNLPNFAFQWLIQLERLSLSKNRIKKITDKTLRAGPMHLRSLNLGSNQIDHLSSSAFDSLPNLEQLFLNNNKIRSLHPQTFTNLKSLRLLALDHNHIKDIGEYAFVLLPALEQLTLAHNHVRAIPSTALASTPHLEMLDLSYNRFTEFSASFLKATSKLTTLNLSYNSIAKLDLVSVRQSLEELGAAHNRLQYIDSKAFSEFERLRFVDLSNNQIIELDQNCFRSTPLLTTVKLDNNNIKKIWRGTFARQRLITHLSLSSNQLSDLDSGVFSSNNVLELYLQNNSFPKIPLDALASLGQSLTVLDLSYNKIRALNQDSFKGLQNITKLILASNNIESIDEAAFATLPALRYLDLSNNPITTWSPNSFRDIAHSLEVLNIAQTGLFSLPKVNSRSLHYLNISHNKIYEIKASDVDVLQHIETLDASWNTIVEIGSEILEMSSLRYLDLSGNRIKHIRAVQLNYLDRLETLKIAHLSSLKELPPVHEFAKLRNLKHFEIHNIPALTANYNISRILRMLPPLRSIDIEIMEDELDNQLKLADLRLLRSVTIRGHNLKKLSTGAFEKLRGYKMQLMIRDTQIDFIPPLVFNTMTSISYLSLSLINNQLQSFNPFLHSTAPVLNQHGTLLESLDLRNNPIFCDCRLHWLSAWIEYASEHSQHWPKTREGLEATECDARPGTEDTLLSVYGDGINGIVVKERPTITADQMCSSLSAATRTPPTALMRLFFTAAILWLVH